MNSSKMSQILAAVVLCQNLSLLDGMHCQVLFQYCFVSFVVQDMGMCGWVGGHFACCYQLLRSCFYHGATTGLQCLYQKELAGHLAPFTVIA